MANVKPLADRILLRRLEAEEVVRGGIIIPDTAQEKPLRQWSSLWAMAGATTRARDFRSRWKLVIGY